MQNLPVDDKRKMNKGGKKKVSGKKKTEEETRASDGWNLILE